MTTAILYQDPAADSRRDRSVLGDGMGTVFVPVSGVDAAAGHVGDLVADGVTRIELCGALGPRALARVRPMVDPSVPVGVCTFGVESVAGAVAFEQRLVGGNGVDVVLMTLVPGADPDSDRVQVGNPAAAIHLVPVPDGPTAARVAADRVAASAADLIELYDGLDACATGLVLGAVGGAAPVGTVLYPGGHAPAALSVVTA